MIASKEMLNTSDLKIISFEQLDCILHTYTQKKKIVHCHGVFDLLHIGHIRHFQSAKKYGDLVIVTITPDKYVNKGPNRPCFTEKLRAEAIAALDCVDYVIINSWPTAVEAIKHIKPHIYVKGSEYQDQKNDLTSKIQEEINAVKSVGGDIAYTDDIVFSSSKLLNEFFTPFNPEVSEYLSLFKTKYNSKYILEYLENAKDLNVLIVGEAIIDIYHFSEVIGKAGKEPTLVAKHQKIEKYLGGSLALANHLSSFCNRVTCLTYLGENAEYEDTIRAGLKPNVELIAVYKKNSPTIVKRRYLETYLRQKLFEVYEINDDFLESDQRKKFLKKLSLLSNQNDLVITADFGHGLIDDEIVKSIISDSKFLAVNAQSNAGNHGFNCISKYPKADYVSIASRELQLNFRQRHLSVLEQFQRLMSELKYKTAMITNGIHGAFASKINEPICQAPAFSNKVVDRVGAGDAVLAITSLFAYQQAPAEVIAFIGNVVGAEAVSIMGNSRYIDKVPFIKHIHHLLK